MSHREMCLCYHWRVCVCVCVCVRCVCAVPHPLRLAHADEFGLVRGQKTGGSWETATLTDAERTACGGERRGCKDVEGGPHVQAAQRHGHHRRRPVCARVPPACSAPSDPPAARAPQALRAAPPAAGLRAPRRPAAPGAPCGLPDMCTDTATAAAVAAAAVAAAGTNPRPSPTTRA